MRTFTIAAASALLLAYLVTEAVSRFWPNQYVALLLATIVALLVNGLFNARLAVRDAPTGRRQRGEGQARGRQRDRQAKPRAERGRRERQPTSNKPAVDGPSETGEVKWFNRAKGYGFIVRANGDEIFVHQRSIVSGSNDRQRPLLRDGQKVRFVVTHQDKGAQAEQVEPLD